MMGEEASKQKFAIASSMYLEGRYEEAFSLLDELGKQHPGVFNVQYPMLQCLQRLERLEDVKEFHTQMVSLYTKQKEQDKLASVEEWITNMERQSSLGIVGLEMDVDPGVLGGDIMGDLFEPSASQKHSSASSVRMARASSNTQWTARVVIALLVVTAAVAGYLFLPRFLGGAPSFTANIVLGLPYANLEGKFFRKNMDISRTEMMGKVVITKEGKVYTIIPQAEKYSVMGLQEMAGQSPLAEMSNFKKWIDGNGGKKTGQESLYGYLCDVYEAKVRMSPALPPADTKIWYAQELAFPVKSETITVGVLGKVVMFLKDIKTGALSNSLFEIPAGYAKVDAEELSSMDAGASAGAVMPPAGTGNAPDNTKNMSPQEMQKLLQQFNIK